MGHQVLSHDEVLIDEDHHLHQPKRLRIVGIGAGMSGLILAYKAKHELKMLDEHCSLQIYERLSTVGGTWNTWRYPGVACDIPAANYALPFAPNPKWSRFYAGGDEIQAYTESVADEFGLRELISFDSKVSSAKWDQDAGKWHFEIEKNGQVIKDWAHIFFNGTGFTTEWSWPQIPGIETFKGKMLHPAAWDASYAYTGKKIALIGNGSTAIQLLPALQPDAESLTTFIRSPTWISPGLGAQHTPDKNGANFSYSKEQHQAWIEDPQKYHDYRKALEMEFNAAYDFTTAGTDLQTQLVGHVRGQMEDAMKNMDAETRKKLIPEWAFGCRRITPGEGYLSALQKPNVAIEFSDITHFTEKGLLVNSGKEHEFDLIVTATGFDVSMKPHFDIVGLNGAHLGDGWVQEDGPPCYMGRCYSGFPNMFMSLASNSVFGHGSFIPALEVGVEYALKAAKRMSEESIKSMNLKVEAYQEFDAFQRKFNLRTVWVSNCRSWYKSNTVDGKPLQYPGSVLHFRQILDTVRWEDYDLSYEGGNRFAALMRNGRTKQEVTKGGDLAYYMEVDRPTKYCGKEYTAPTKISG